MRMLVAHSPVEYLTSAPKGTAIKSQRLQIIRE
ncbi:hypothetical protein JOC94_000149 [Bacillus thermophilus]|uniref:Uncharacterized protein n=1 Tax=Siminovitchia thermophila TaxID=1245522 RepID=A0ABS2R0L7_9BACI|nr:hypothetical protein [Siminovitchia thermophila]